MGRIPTTDAERHQLQHDLIDERKTAYDALPKSNDGRTRIRRREADKKAWWTFTGHLRGMHGCRTTSFLRMTWADLERIHAEKHREES